MKCRKQPPFQIPEPIANIWETLIHENTWERIVVLRKTLRTSYSWVVRFCVFRLLERKDLNLLLENIDIESIRKRPGKNYHRLQLCLYGMDEKRFRLAALETGISISALIRIALQKYLHKLEFNFRVSKEECITTAIKIIKTAQLDKIFQEKIPCVQTWYLTGYS